MLTLHMDRSTIFSLSFLPTNLTKTKRNIEIHTLTCVHCGINTLTICKCKYFSRKYASLFGLLSSSSGLCVMPVADLQNNFLLPIFEPSSPLPSSSSSVSEFFDEDYVHVDLRDVLYAGPTMSLLSISSLQSYKWLIVVAPMDWI